MKPRPIVPREQANRDVDDAITYYLNDAGEAVALGFIDALGQAYGHVGCFPATGSSSYGRELNLPGLRTWPSTHYPYLVFHIECPDRIDVWRVLHSQRDIPRGCRGAIACDSPAHRAVSNLAGYVSSASPHRARLFSYFST